MKQAVLSVKDLTIRRGHTTILSHIDWEIRPGENWVILGPNGSGKTCLLKALAGYMPPSDGDISVLGETYGESDWRELREKIGVVSASIAHLVHDDDSALEIVEGGRHAMVGVWGKVSAADRARAIRNLRAFRASYVKDRQWGILSQGERQRVLIARALMADPRILILDEPCSGLDPLAREHFLNDLAVLLKKKARPSVILVTHHIEEILPDFTHVLALKSGRLVSAQEIGKTVTSLGLGSLFGAKVRVRRSHGRYSLDVLAKSPGTSST